MSPAMMSAPSDSHKANVEWKLKLDKLTLLLDIPEQWKEGLVSSYIELVTKTELQSTHGVTRSYSSGCRGYEVSIVGRVPLSTAPLIWSKDAGYLLQAGPKQGQKSFFRLDINPLALTPSGMAHLIEKLDDIFGVPWPAWRFARVSRIDVAVDLYGVSLTDWVWDLTGRRSREVICRNNEVRTIYLGAKRQSPLVVYNKGHQDPSLAAGCALTRVEGRIKYAGDVSGLTTLANPMAKVQVLNPRKLAFPDPHREALLSVGHLHGRLGILRTFPALMRPKVDLGLASGVAPWWDPAAVWEAWETCLTQTLPSLIDPAGAAEGAAQAYQQAMKQQKAALMACPECN